MRQYCDIRVHHATQDRQKSEEIVREGRVRAPTDTSKCVRVLSDSHTDVPRKAGRAMPGPRKTGNDMAK